MMILSMGYLAQVRERVGHCYCELGTPLLGHASSRCPAVRRPKVSHTQTRVGSREESVPPSAWTESGWTPVLQGIV